jgi:hypothetical protein
MAKDILSWNDVKERYLEFHRMDKFTENMAIDVDFGYWLVNNCIIPDVMAMLPTESQLDEIAFRKYGNDPEGAIKFNLIKRMAFVEGCEFMLRLLKGN